MISLGSIGLSKMEAGYDGLLKTKSHASFSFLLVDL